MLLYCGIVGKPDDKLRAHIQFTYTLYRTVHELCVL